jgi:hypothetical protein
VAASLKVACSTAFRWRHRFLALPKTVPAQALMGIAEGDETSPCTRARGNARVIGNPCGAAAKPPGGACLESVSTEAEI